jgi:hypothetical protein
MDPKPMMLPRTTSSHFIVFGLVPTLLSTLDGGVSAAFLNPPRSRGRSGRTDIVVGDPSKTTENGSAPSVPSPRFMFDFLKGKGEDVSSSRGKEDQAAQQDAADFSDDPVDKMFSLFFGKKEEAPMGMKRFGRGEIEREMAAMQL